MVEESRKARGDRMLKALGAVAAVLLVVGIALGGLAFGRYVVPEKSSASSSGASASNGSSPASRQFDFSVLNDIMSTLEKEYVKPDNIDEQSLYEAAINGMLNTLNDSGTYYLDPDTFKVNVNPSGTFDGIGATVSQQNNEIVIVSPIKGTPAEAAGIRSGDVVLSVDGESTKGWSTEKAVLKIRGPRGTKVTLSIRHDDGTTQDYTLTRAQVPIESVTAAPAGTVKDGSGNAVNDLGYIRIREFTARTPQEMSNALKDVMNAGAKGLIIDVRGNPGGVRDAVVSVADMFLDSGTILVQRDRDGRERTFSARPGDDSKGLPIVLLQDKNSASASEILSAALQDNGRATVVGEKSFGKATVNVSNELKDGGALFVSIAQWLTPKGALIDKVGVRPDVEVTLSDQDIDQKRDSQLFKAIDVLHSQGATSKPAGSP